ncbi:hypothetical protein DFQ01_105239 [Paenibacillus cellulosilyticus]|uniref:Uncharacterized protein n=1 Tax=Paenibacillus cellulosilyticus TaxID=375489 RepID=A0A2V2Z4J8_9BACL|nr:hypothetical protein [Paenibacillus cellulosilyticus]PWW05255.1 hypothetical protein DFQ01_105239 [Paenibacillus cellulosilyticus]QKS43579.1 hypothetical protein HUB94_03335 [Paenibacillus cellulosilyticus]
MRGGNENSNVGFTKVPIQIPNDSRYIDPVVDYIRRIIKPDQLVTTDSHWDYYLGESVEFTKDGVDMAYEWNESWGHELTTKAKTEQAAKALRETAASITDHIKRVQ